MLLMKVTSYSLMVLIATEINDCLCPLIGVAGELDDLNDVDEQQCLDCIVKHLDKIVGVKVRLTAQIANSGKHEHEAFRYYILSWILVHDQACIAGWGGRSITGLHILQNLINVVATNIIGGKWAVVTRSLVPRPIPSFATFFSVQH